VIFVLTKSRKKKRCQALKQYCALHNWEYSERNERLLCAFLIRGDGWELESGIEMPERGSESGSPDAFLYTFWNGSGPLCVPAPFQFGTVSSADLPYINGAMPLISSLLSQRGETGLVPAPFRPPLDKRFLILAQPGTSSSVLGQSVEKLLAAWPLAWPLHAGTDTDHILLQLKGKRLQTPKELDQLVNLGQAMLEHFKE